VPGTKSCAFSFITTVSITAPGLAFHLLDDDEAKRAGKDSNNIAEGFQISGLGQLIDAGIQADRLIAFGD
jgi:hypothetical protein